MHLLLKEIRHNPILWLLGFVPVLFAVAALAPQAHRLLFVLAVLATLPLAVTTPKSHLLSGFDGIATLAGDLSQRLRSNSIGYDPKSHLL
jgi:hypothetical protein